MRADSRVESVPGFIFNRLSAAVWADKGLRSFMQYRDLGASVATCGRMRAEHIRVVRPVEKLTGWHCHDLDFQLVYILAGEMSLSFENRDDIVLKAGDCAHIPPFNMHNEFGFSNDYEVLLVTLPAEFDTLTQRPDSRRGRPDTGLVISQLSTDSFVRGGQGDGLRSFLEYRDLGFGEATKGAVAGSVVRSNGPCAQSTGWHYHDVQVQFVFVLSGSVTTQLEGVGDLKLGAGDSMTLPPSMKHNVVDFSSDFEVFEIYVPAKFGTFPA
jgi:quercetin dioxygenase-like cupin family protein